MKMKTNTNTRGKPTIECAIVLEAKQPTDFTIGYWYRETQEMPEYEQEHVIKMLEEGYIEGELNDSNENRGWWHVIKQSKSF